MFCTLTHEKSKKRFHKNIKIENKSVGTVDFIKVTCYKNINPKKIEKKLSKIADTIILPEELQSLHFNKIKINNSNEFLKEIALLTFKNILVQSQIPANKLSISIQDEKAIFADFVYSLAKRASIIKISTKNALEYESVANDMYNEFGMKPIISETTGNADIGINFDNENPIIWFNSPENYCEIKKECIKLGAGLKSYVPKGITEYDFADVLRKYKDFKRLNLITAELMINNGKLYKINRENIKNFLDNEVKNC